MLLVSIVLWLLSRISQRYARLEGLTGLLGKVSKASFVVFVINSIVYTAVAVGVLTSIYFSSETELLLFLADPWGPRVEATICLVIVWIVSSWVVENRKGGAQ